MHTVFQSNVVPWDILQSRVTNLTLNKAFVISMVGMGVMVYEDMIYCLNVSKSC